jgi:hypothetical protein
MKPADKKIYQVFGWLMVNRETERIVVDRIFDSYADASNYVYEIEKVVQKTEHLKWQINAIYVKADA